MKSKMKIKDIKASSQGVTKDSASPASKPPAIKFVEGAELDGNAPNQNNDVEESKEGHAYQIDIGRI